jgi:DNA-binding NarL/FixJ family response regulator
MLPERRWTPEDEQRLLKLRAEGLPWDKIASQLLRSEAAVKVRASKLKRQLKAQNKEDSP